MTDTSGEINLQSKQDIICHVGKVKLATSDYMADVIPFLASVVLTSVLRFILSSRYRKQNDIQSAFYHKSALSVSTGLLSAVYSLYVFDCSIKDQNLNPINIEACVAGSRTQLPFALLAASQQSSDRSDKISWLIANLKVATLRIEFLNNNTTPPFLLYTAVSTKVVPYCQA